MRVLPILFLTAGTLFTSVTTRAEGLGQGGCSLREDAPVYDHSSGDKVVAKVKLHACVVGITTRGILGNEYVFEREGGRVHVAAFKNAEEKGMYGTAWMDPADLSTFTFQCGCGTGKKEKEKCTPFQGHFSKEWNPCFLEARDKKQAELKSQPASPQPAASRSEKALTNDDVLSLVKVGLDEQTIIAKINHAPEVAFDTSTDGLVKLKSAKVSNAIIDAMLNRTSKK